MLAVNYGNKKLGDIAMENGIIYVSQGKISQIEQKGTVTIQASY